MRKKYHIVSTAYDKGGNVISRGYNQYTKSNTWQKELSLLAGLSEERIFLHSEVSCLIRARNLGKKVHTLKIERYGVDNSPKIAFPCKSCQIAIKLSGVKKVIFTTDEGFSEWLV